MFQLKGFDIIINGREIFTDGFSYKEFLSFGRYFMPGITIIPRYFMLKILIFAG